MVKSSIVTNPVDITIQIAKAEKQDSWQVTPSLIAYPLPTQPPPAKNIIFILDVSGSMGERLTSNPSTQISETRLSKVKDAVKSLLDKLEHNDTFSVVIFNSSASAIVEHQYASPDKIQEAKLNIANIKAHGNTNFKAAFEAVNELKMIRPNMDTRIIFLTDGLNDFKIDPDKDLLQPLINRAYLRVIPIGIYDERSQSAKDNIHLFLDELAKLGKGKAFYINEANAGDYQAAFDDAFEMLSESAQSPTELNMTIRAKNKTDVTDVYVERELKPVCFNGQTATTTLLHFDSPTPPCHIDFCFHSDDMSLQASHRLTAEELDQLNQGKSIKLAIPEFNWKNNRNNPRCSWISAFGSLAIGLLLVAGTVLFVLASPQLSISLLMWKTLAMVAIAAVTGSILFINGMVAVTRQYHLPTKLAAHFTSQQQQQASSRLSPGFFASGQPERGGRGGCWSRLHTAIGAFIPGCG